MITADSSNVSAVVTTIEFPHANIFTDTRVATLSFFNFWNVHTVTLKLNISRTNHFIGVRWTKLMELTIGRGTLQTKGNLSLQVSSFHLPLL